MWKVGLWFFLCGIIFKSIIKRPLYCAAESSGLYICDSWNTYHVIKTVQVDPFVPNLHFELPEDDNYLFTVRQMRGRGCEGRGWQQREMVEDDWNCLMHRGGGGVLFCMAMVGQGGWFHNGWVDKCRGAGSVWSWEGFLPQEWKDLCILTVPLTPFHKKTCTYNVQFCTKSTLP